MASSRLTLAEFGDICHALTCAREGYLRLEAITACDQDIMILLAKAETHLTDAAATLRLVLQKGMIP